MNLVCKTFVSVFPRVVVMIRILILSSGVVWFILYFATGTIEISILHFMKWNKSHLNSHKDFKNGMVNQWNTENSSDCSFPCVIHFRINYHHIQSHSIGMQIILKQRWHQKLITLHPMICVLMWVEWTNGLNVNVTILNQTVYVISIK